MVRLVDYDPYAQTYSLRVDGTSASNTALASPDFATLGTARKLICDVDTHLLPPVCPPPTIFIEGQDPREVNNSTVAFRYTP